jgi:hypothetical protein
MRAKEFVIEYRDRMFQYIKSVLPKWPDYVLKDWIYFLARGDHQAGVYYKPDDSNDKYGFNKETILKMVKDTGLSPDTKWQLVPNMKFTMDMWTPEFQKLFTQRIHDVSAGKTDSDRDTQRHATQSNLAGKEGGVRKEPVLLIKYPNGYTLLEGWHRTTQHFLKYPDGYTGPAYVAVANTVNEAPLPPDWDPEKLNLRQTFKDRLKYALERAKRLGGGSSRVAMTIDYEGRPTVLKVAKNLKGLAQNEVEVDILKDGYIGKMPIVIPLIDFDKENNRPVWIQTEQAKKVRGDTLHKMLHTPSMWLLTNKARNILGQRKPHEMDDEKIKKYYFETHNNLWKPTEEGYEIFEEYANEIADLVNSSGLSIGDLQAPSNWGVFNERPVVIDLGLNENVWQNLYVKGKK